MKTRIFKGLALLLLFSITAQAKTKTYVHFTSSKKHVLGKRSSKRVTKFLDKRSCVKTVVQKIDEVMAKPAIVEEIESLRQIANAKGVHVRHRFIEVEHEFGKDLDSFIFLVFKRPKDKRLKWKDDQGAFLIAEDNAIQNAKNVLMEHRNTPYGERGDLDAAMQRAYTTQPCSDENFLNSISEDELLKSIRLVKEEVQEIIDN